MLLLTRRTPSTEAYERECSLGLRYKRPIAPGISHVIVVLADGTTEHYTGSRYSIRAAYSKHAGADNHIVSLRWTTQPLHLLTRGE